MTDKKLIILLIEDNPGDARLVEEMLKDAFGEDFELIRADRLSSGLKKLFEGGVDIVLLDLTLPDSQELHTLNWVQIQAKGAPVVVLTGIDDQSVALEAVKSGAQDFLIKGQFDSKVLARSIRYAVERQETMENLIKAQEELEQSKRLSEIGSLAAVVAHRLRTPLAAIHLATFNMRRKTQDPQMERHFTNIEKKLQESDRLINSLLFYAGGMKLPQYEKVNMCEILDECVSMIEKKYEGKAVHVEKKYGPICEIAIDADPFQIKELFCNLIGNSYDAVFDKDGAVIEISAETDKTELLKIYIKDNGTGIDKEDLKSIFDLFFTTKVTGTGLGLNVSLQIARLHKGHIDIESEKGKWTLVTVTLPIKK